MCRTRGGWLDGLSSIAGPSARSNGEAEVDSAWLSVLAGLAGIVAGALASAYAANRSARASETQARASRDAAAAAAEEARIEARDARLWKSQEADIARLTLERDYWRGLTLDLLRVSERLADTPPLPPASGETAPS